jgi:hypothetical protein
MYLKKCFALNAFDQWQELFDVWYSCDIPPLCHAKLLRGIYSRMHVKQFLRTIEMTRNKCKSPN